jgi:hypothetical protein
VKKKVTEAVDVSRGTSRSRLGETGTEGGILYRLRRIVFAVSGISIARSVISIVGIQLIFTSQIIRRA